jgi:hypothetical protein
MFRRHIEYILVVNLCVITEGKYDKLGDMEVDI